jgi:predicted solute-binding protein
MAVIVEKSIAKAREEDLKRKYKKSIAFNSQEIKAIDKYCQRYKVSNPTKFIRQAVMQVVFKKFTDDYPTLWDQPGITVQPRFKF